jgi:hypothetical protein
MNSKNVKQIAVYTVFFIGVHLFKHFFGFEDTVLAGLAWIITDTTLLSI